MRRRRVPWNLCNLCRADQRPGGREHFRPRKRVSDPICAGGRGRGAGYRRRYGDGHAGAKSESVKINSSVSQQDGGVVLSLR